MYSKGLIIFTNDGDFAATLSHPSAELEKEYIVETSQNIPAEFPENFKRGIRANGVFYKCRDAQILKDRKIRIVLIEGKNREIRNVLDSINIGTKSLTRVRIGNVSIQDMKPGEFRDLSQSEVSELLSLTTKHIAFFCILCYRAGKRLQAIIASLWWEMRSNHDRIMRACGVVQIMIYRRVTSELWGIAVRLVPQKTPPRVILSEA